MSELTSKVNLEAFVVKRENLDALEDSLGWYGDEYLRLQRNHAALNLDQRIPKQRMTGLFGEVQRTTTNILNITDAGKILLSYYEWKPYLKFSAKRAAAIGTGIGALSMLGGVGMNNILVGVGSFALLSMALFADSQSRFGTSHYDSSSRIVFIGQRDNTEAKSSSIMAEGVAQHILHQRTYLYDRGTEDYYIGHGFAVGMKRLVGQKLYEQHRNPVYRYQPLKDFTGELKEAYLTVCAHNGLEPKSSLANSDIPSLRGGINRITLLRDWWTYPWALGTAVMAIGETKSGEGVYRSLLNEDLSFLRQ